MSDNLADRLRKLQAARDADAIDDEMYQARVAKFRAEYGADLVDALLRQPLPTETRSHTQHIGGYATIAAAIAGDFTGTLYIIGERAQTTGQVLAGYLRWLGSQCGTLPLRGVREQKAAGDVLRMSLEQVYTQLATTTLIARESFAGAALQALDVSQYIADHSGADLLPSRLRLTIRLRDPEHRRTSTGSGRDRADFADELRSNEIDLRTAAAESVVRAIQGSDGFTAFGSQLVTEAIADHPRMVLLGEPGSGKSTTLRYLALTLAHAGLDSTFALGNRLGGWDRLGDQGKLLPILMPVLPMARRLTERRGRAGTAADLWAALDAHLTTHGATAAVVAAVREELARGHVLVLLDGLDEVAGADSRRQVVETVQAFAGEQPQCRIVVACRVRAYNGPQNQAWQLPGWPTTTLADWEPSQVQAFIHAWYTAAATASNLPNARRDERIAQLQQAARQRDDLRRLGVRPLLLTIMALVHLNDGRLPEDRVNLYARCLDILLAQWEIAGKDETVYGTLMDYVGLPDVDVKRLRELLARVAFTAQQAAKVNAVGRLSRAELREMVMDEFARLGHPNPYDGAQRFLEYTDVRSGLLQANDAGDAYAFPHQTFQEYLAGLELVRGVDFVDRIMERRADDRWRVPIFLGVGHTVSERVLAAPYQLLSRLIHARERTAAQRARDLILAADITEDVGWNRLEGDEFQALQRDLAQALAPVVEGTALPAAERVRAGALLGRLGDPRPGVCDLPPTMIEFTGGTFVIGSTPEQAEDAGKAYEQYWLDQGNKETAQSARTWPQDEINDQPSTVAPFAIGRYPVTNAQYARFLADDGYNPSRPWWDDAGQAWLARDDAATEDLESWRQRAYKQQPEFWDNERFGQTRSNHPVVGVSWYEAVAFCAWLSQHPVYNPQGYVYRLPTEAEWEYAARGMARRIYPWGKEAPDGERANFDQIYDGTSAVGCFPLGATAENVHDLAGNVWEWTGSVYTPYPYDPDDGREQLDNPAEKYFTLRGGGWNNPSINLRASARNNNLPDYHYNNVGFRLARRPPL
jgi:formylglycine-generating enzyme required for sulfatase activity